MSNESLEINLEFYDKKGRVIERRTRKDAKVDLRQLAKQNYSEIRIKTHKSNDIFVSASAEVIADRSSDNTLHVWVPNYSCVLIIAGGKTILSQIATFVRTPLLIAKENTPPKNVAASNTPTKGKRGFGIVTKDLFGTGYSPELKLRNPELRRPHSSGKKYGSSEKRPSPTAKTDAAMEAAGFPRRNIFMGMMNTAIGITSPAKEKFALTDVQKQVLDACQRGKNVFYTGGAGTGKSTLLTRLIESLVAQHGHKKVFVAATTGLAACAVGGTTVHQFAGISSMLDESGNAATVKAQHDRVVNQCCSKPYVVRRFREAVVLLVDEISMLSPVLLEVLNGIAQKARADSRPMGGMQVVFSGDFFQLPPVSKSPAESASGSSGYMSAATSKGDSAGVRFCFQSPLWDALIQDSFDLQQVYRQSGDNDFIEVLNSVRCGQYTAQCSAVLGACVGRRLDCTDGILPTQIFTHKRDVDKLNSIRIAELPGTSMVYEASDSGDDAYLRMIQSHCPARQRLELKVGCQVILVKTTAALEGLVNGARGIVTRFVKETSKPIVKFVDGTERAIGNEIFTISLGGAVVAQRSQLPLDLSWGISVHKSQGMTVDKAMLHLRNVFECGQAYVALSRVKTVDGLSLSHPIQQAQVRAHPAVVAFYSRMNRSSCT